MIVEDNLDLAVFCTDSILKQNIGIDAVFHDKDDDYSFLNRQEEDRKICILSLEEVIGLDPSVAQVLDIPLGYVAWRVDSNSEWIIAPYEEYG